MRRAGLLEGLPQDRHAHHRMGGAFSLVAVVAGRARQRLLHVLAGEDAERARDAGVELRLLDATRRLAAHVVVMVGLAADHRAEAGDAREAPGLRGPLGREGELEGARDLEDVDGGRTDTALVESQDRAVRESLGEIRIERADADRKLETAQD